MVKVLETSINLKLYPLDQQGVADLFKLSDAMKFQPNNYWRADSYQIYVATGGADGWDGYIRLLRYSRASDHGLLRRGFLDDLLAKAAELGVQLNTSTLLPQPFKGLSVDDIPDDIVDFGTRGFKLDMLQRQAVVDWLANGIGICNATVSAGKTVMLSAAAAMVKRRYPKARFLYFTQTERLVHQVIAEMQQFLPDWHITQFGGGVKDNTGKDIVVATGAMLHRNFKKLKASGWFNSFYGLLGDEVHHCASTTQENICLHIPAFFRFGASDTLKSEDPSAWHTIRGLFGPVRSKIAFHQLVDHSTNASSPELKRLAKPHLYLVDIPTWKGSFRGLTHAPETDSEAYALLDGEWKKGTYLGPVYLRDDDGELSKDDEGNLIKQDNVHLLKLDGAEYEIESKWCLLERVRDKAVIRFNERNRLIKEWVAHYASLNKRTLVVCTPTLHIIILQSLLSKVLGEEKVRILYSEHSSKERDAAFQWIKTHPGCVLISSLVKEGVSIPELDAGVIADHVVSSEVMRQIVGRFVRKKPTGDNRADITLFIDRQHNKLAKGSIEMLGKLAETRAFDFYHPCSTPQRASEAVHFDGSAD